jgi:hypothetical protein
MALLLALFGGCTTNNYAGVGGPGTPPESYAVIVANGWINDWVWVRSVDGEQTTDPTFTLIGHNLYRVPPGEHEITYQFFRRTVHEDVPEHTDTVTMKGGKTYRVKPLFNKDGEWVEYAQGVVPSPITDESIKYEFVETTMEQVYQTCQNTDTGVRCSTSLKTRP